GTVNPLGGIGFADAPTAPASTNVTPIAPAEARRLPMYIRDPSLDPTLPRSLPRPRGARQQSVDEWGAEISPHLTENYSLTARSSAFSALSTCASLAWTAGSAFTTASGLPLCASVSRLRTESAPWSIPFT